MLDISKKLKELRKKHNYTIQAVSDSIGIAVRTYQNYEYGQREISTEALYKLADFYGVTTDYLLGRDTGEPDTLDKLADEFNMSSLERKVIDNYFSLPTSIRSDFIKFLSKTFSGFQEESGE